ncbi:hypothetical protein BpHYR1_028327 [Brachionus plicatilis]|uniref:Uncharacterized protein n=1 Tax=Brachionus plicatilis TaxID=10195 RepID=A0A3M7R3Z1_BRAPC|nr:hypothetical protein BpHYR1_028327 [Brachionus plicatilis]
MQLLLVFFSISLHEYADFYDLIRSFIAQNGLRNLIFKRNLNANCEYNMILCSSTEQNDD